MKKIAIISITMLTAVSIFALMAQSTKSQPTDVPSGAVGLGRQAEVNSSNLIYNDATSYHDVATASLNEQIAWTNYVAQIDPDSLERARKSLVAPLPPSRKEMRKKAMESISRIIYRAESESGQYLDFRDEVITDSVLGRPYREIIKPYGSSSKPSSEVPYRKVSLVYRSGVKVTRTAKGSEKIEDFDSGTIEMSYRGRKVPFIIDPPERCDCEEDSIWSDTTALLKRSRSATAEILLTYERFDVYVDSGISAQVGSDIITFFDQFEPRLDALEQETGWSSEKFNNGQKLEIQVSETSGCSQGVGANEDGVVYFIASNPFYRTECFPESGTGTGPLGDDWPVMGTLIHEVIHAINPNPIFWRLWLTEGWAEYHEYNLLSNYGDISQATADSKIFSGTSFYNWVGYVSNDYKDTSPSNNEIQESNGYDITAWMFTMMRNDTDKLLNWDTYYTLLDDNHETLNTALAYYQTSWYYIDMVIIDLFGRSIGLDFAAIKDIWEYDGPSGPGWGVRQWVPIDWYGDVSPVVGFSNPYPVVNQTFDIVTTIHNSGEVNFIDMPVNIYIDGALIDSLYVDVAALDSVVLATPVSLAEGTYTVATIVDEQNIKIESNEFNNTDSTTVMVDTDADSDGIGDSTDNCPDIWNPDQTDTDDDGTGDACDGCCLWDRGDVNNDSGVDVSDLGYLVDYLFRGGPEPVCPEEADVNGSGGTDVSDLGYIVDYLFRGGPAPVVCP